MAVSSGSNSMLTTGPVTIRFDGSVRDGPDQDQPSAAIGYVIEDVMSNSVLMKSSQSLDCWVSNTYVEFDAMISALTRLRELDYSGHLYICGDAKAVIELADPDTKSTPNSALMADYVTTTQCLLEEFAGVTLNYVLRKNNKEADRLAAEGHQRDESPTEQYTNH